MKKSKRAREPEFIEYAQMQEDMNKTAGGWGMDTQTTDNHVGLNVHYLTNATNATCYNAGDLK